MDDYSVSSLTESKNEWCARLVSILTPAIVEGLKSIFQEAVKLCQENDEFEKYLLTFQTFLSRVPKWNDSIIEEERKRISTVSGCNYIEDLITCVHIIQLKALTCIRVGQTQKKIDIDIPSPDVFVHKVYTNVARKVYTNVYLFEKDIPPLQVQKHNRELEVMIKECIMQTIRDTMPIEDILRAYMAETTEEDVEVKKEIIETPAPEPEPEPEPEKEVAAKESTNETNKGSEKIEKTESDTNKMEAAVERMQETFDVVTTPEMPSNIAFSDVDSTMDTNGVEGSINAPKDIERLEKIAFDANERRKAEEAEYDDEDDMPLTIGQEVKLEIADVNDLNRDVAIKPIPLLDVETLI